MFKERLITALILAPLALAAVFLLPLIPFALLMGLLVLVGAWEWSNLALHRRTHRWLYVGSVALLLFITHQMLAWVELPILIAAFAFWWFALSRVGRYPQTKGIEQTSTKIFIGYLVLIPAWVAMVGMKAHPQGNLLIFMLFLLVWGADIGAYFAGKRFGRNKLIPKVSPGKTREGVLGGLSVCVMVAIGFSISAQLSAGSTVLLLLLALVTGMVSVLGDLFESMFKRERGIKDSGRILPGHGGILDRIDSLTAAAPIFLLGQYWMHIF